MRTVNLNGKKMFQEATIDDFKEVKAAVREEIMKRLPKKKGEEFCCAVDEAMTNAATNHEDGYFGVSISTIPRKNQVKVKVENRTYWKPPTLDQIEQPAINDIDCLDTHCRGLLLMRVLSDKMWYKKKRKRWLNGLRLEAFLVKNF